MDRFDLVKESFTRKEVPAEIPAGKTSDWYGELVFDRAKMCKYLDARTCLPVLKAARRWTARRRTGLPGA